MKALLFTAVISLMFVLSCKNNDYSTNTPPVSTGRTHVVNAGGTTFVPNNFTANVGDTVKFDWTSGTHTTTSTLVPAGASVWDSPLTSSNSTFIYVITKTGEYDYQCTFHASMGMTGKFTVN